MLFLVGSKDSTEPTWIAVERDMRVYCYLSASGKFHYNHGLSVDWVWDRDLRYHQISVVRAMKLIDAGQVGALDRIEHREVLSHLLAADSMAVADAVIDEPRGTVER